MSLRCNTDFLSEDELRVLKELREEFRRLTPGEKKAYFSTDWKFNEAMIRERLKGVKPCA